MRIEHARYATNGMVCSVDHLASAAGIELLANGGNAVDAAVGTSAVLAVTTQHMCGMGGDLWALVHVPGEPTPFALNASGWAGAGSDAAALRSEGFDEMPFRGDLRSVPVPGCVDGWVALHGRFGRLPLAAVLEPARRLADEGFPASPMLARAAVEIAGVDGAEDYTIDGEVVRDGQVMTRKGLARSIGAIAAEGRNGWYGGEFGAGLIEKGGGLYDAADLAHVHAEWVEPTRVDAWGQQLWTAPPNSQGYLSLAAASIASGLDLPEDPADPLFAHYLIEASKQAAFDRNEVLFDGADGAALVDEARLGARRARISPDRAFDVRPPTAGGGTIYLCTTDADRMGVSLIQSNAAGFGSFLAVAGVGVFLHNRGIGFSVEAGHPAELQPGKRPPSTLAPALATTPGGQLRTVFGCMGGDAQPQVVLQMAARRFAAEQRVGHLMTASRFSLTVPAAQGFNTWSATGPLTVAVEAGSRWIEGLQARGHHVEERRWGDGLFGHAHMIDVVGDHFEGVADPRALTGAAIGR
jgi:gamma-glutamyltranspeptidase/glutathione hydrolase